MARAELIDLLYNGEPGEWKLKNYIACGWPVAVPPGNSQPTDNGATDFPRTDSGAVYVLADGADADEAVYLRRVVGESCPRPGTVCTPAYEIQGPGSKSPFLGQTATTCDIVTRIFLPTIASIQDATGDGNNETSDALEIKFPLDGSL